MPTPTIITQPASVTAAAGDTATLITLAASNGNGPLTYQWIKLGNYYEGNATITGGGNYSGYDTNILRITNLSASVVGMYGCSVSSQLGGSVSTKIVAVLLNGMVLPKINGHSADQTVNAGSEASFSVVVGSPDNDPASFQWLKNGQPIGGDHVSGATTANVTISGVTAFTADYYQCRISNSVGIILSDPIGLTVVVSGTTHAPQGYPPLSGILAITAPTDSGTGTGNGGTTTTGGLWTFNGQSAASLGIAQVQRQRRSLDIDTLTFTVVGRPFDAAPLFDFGTTVTVRSPSGIFFYGTITEYPANGSGESENQTYTLSGPWWNLAHMSARQQWNTPSREVKTSLSGRLILGQALDGTRQTTGQTIVSMLQYARNSSAPISIGPIDPGIYAPLDEVKDVSIAEVIRHVMRWHPDCVSWFDYSTTPPALCIRNRANLNLATFTVGIAPLSSVSAITPRKDLQVSAVVIHYEVTGTQNNQPTFYIVTDAAPTGATGAELNAMCLTIPLRGISATSVEQRIETIGIRDSLEVDGSAEIVQFLLTAGFTPLQNKLNADPNITLDGVTITKCSRGLTNPNSTTYDPESGQMVADEYDPSIDRMLINGGITDWMIRDYNVETQEQTLTFDYKTDSGTGGNSGDIQTYKGNTFGFRALNIGNNSDTAASTKYVTLTGYDPGDSPPTGLAASCYAEFNALQYSGSITLVEREATSSAGMGCKLNIAGGTGAYAAMAAMIVGETVDVDAGTTMLTFGPAQHLGPADLIELLRVTRPSVGGRTSGPGALSTGMSDVRTSTT